MKRFDCLSLVGVGCVVLAVACGGKGSNNAGRGNELSTAGDLGASALQRRLASMKPAEPLVPSDSQKQLSAAVDSYFQRAASRRYYLHLDKPLYQPGETIWFRIWELATPTLVPSGSGHGINVELVSPRGATVTQKRVRVDGGVATNDFALPASVPGGEYTVRLASDQGGSAERKLVVSTYQPPQIKKKAEFLRKAYGPGDQVAAAVSLQRGTGEPLANQQITALVTVDQVEVVRKQITTDRKGNTVVKFALPDPIARGDGLLTILVEDGGVTESLQKRIPIVLKEVEFALFPEGGQLVVGLPGRVYFSAKNLLGKPADVSGQVVDQNRNQVVEFTSLHNGMGRFELTPAADKSYFVEITKPVGLKQRIPLPAAVADGCSMQAVDDPLSNREDVRVGVWCSKPQTVIVSGVLREKRLADQAVAIAAGKPTVVALPVARGSQGAVRVTVFDDELRPLAERLVYRGRGNDLKVAITASKPSYIPREQVTLELATTDGAGRPVAADLSLAVVDDTVLSYSDDKTAHLLARLYLESEMPGQEIEEPNFYFGDEAEAPQSLDLVLGTQGWRRFEWQLVLAPPPVGNSADRGEGDLAGMAPDDMEDKAFEEEPMKDRRPAAAPERQGEAKMAPQAAPPEPMGGAAAPVVEEVLAVADRPFDARIAGKRKMEEQDGEWDGDEMAPVATWAPVRVFPAPNYQARYDGPRTDFRETIYWQPSVKTDKTGKATISLYLSDAITSFRATAEGVSAGGMPGRGETLVQSKLPVSLAVKMPLEVSRGDTIRLPVTLSNETSANYDVTVTAQFGAAFQVAGGVPDRVTLKGNERKSFFATLEVVGDGKRAEDGAATIGIDTANLEDEVSRTIKVVPLGFPQEVSLSGTVSGLASHQVNLAGALPGTIEATLTMYPSPLATMVKGTEAIVREPSGCFEQASSANYPNIMVLSYLQEHDAADPALVERTAGMLDRGYKKIAGYESPEKGYEWFGGDPGHEALTAYGLMEFADMIKVYSDVDLAMIKRTQDWLKSRRDGKGGYLRNARALDSFGSASPEVTNGYITFALSETGEKDLALELGYQKKIAASTADPYLLSLAVNTMLNLEPAAETTTSALAKLVELQSQSGAFTGANHSITRSGGVSLDIETTSLAAMAMMKPGNQYLPQVRSAIEWLNGQRGGYGSFGSTQATILALKAMAIYAQASAAIQSDGKAELFINGTKAGELAFAKGQQDALVFDDFAAALRPGDNAIELKLATETALPYSIAIAYRSKLPASSKDAVVAVQTALAKGQVPMGESVVMKLSVKNLSADGIPMTLARVGIPGGLAFQTWQLEELRDKKLVDFYETSEREVVLYFRSLAPNRVVDLDLNLIAQVPGKYVGPASSAYLYYTNEYKHWAEPVKVEIAE